MSQSPLVCTQSQSSSQIPTEDELLKSINNCQHIRFKIEGEVSYEFSKAAFVLWGREVTQLLGISVAQLRINMIQVPLLDKIVVNYIYLLYGFHIFIYKYYPFVGQLFCVKVLSFYVRLVSPIVWNILC